MESTQIRQSEDEHYEKIKVLGKGSMGKVYLMRSKDDSQLYVVKRIRIEHLTDKEKQSTYKEAHIMRTLQHDNVIAFKDIYTTVKQKLCIVMEYAENGDLDKRIEEQAKSGKHFEEKTVLTWFAQIIAGLAYIHSKEIIHRDIKGANIFLGKDDVCKVGDFGIAKYSNQTIDSRVFAGTPGYLSPEMVEGRAYTSKADIWAAGVVLYQLCCLKLPFEANSLPILALRILRGNFAPLPKGLYSKQIKALIESLLKVDAKKRPSAQELLKNPLLKPYLPNKGESKIQSAQSIPCEKDDKRQALRQEMREDLKRKRMAAKSSNQSHSLSETKEQLVAPKAQQKPQQVLEQTNPKLAQTVKPWKLNKKVKSDEVQVELFVPAKKEKKEPEPVPSLKDLKVQIKISEKVRERLNQQQLMRTKAAAEQQYRTHSLKAIVDTPVNPVEEQIEYLPEHIVSQSEDSRQSRSPNSINVSPTQPSHVRLEEVEFNQYEDSYYDGQVESTSHTPDRHSVRLTELEQESLKYITNSNSLEELRLILEERLGEKKFIRAYKVLKEYAEERIASETESLFNKEILKGLLYFLEGQVFQQNIVLLYTLMILEDEEMKSNLDNMNDD